MENKNDIDKDGLTLEQFLNNYSEKDYKKPSVTADILIFSNTEKLELLMIKRGGHPFINSWALVGGFSEINESVDESAKRELFEETGLTDIPLQQLHLFGDTKRDPRTWVITEAYISIIDKTKVSPVANDDAKECDWFTPKLAINDDIWTLSLTNGKDDLVATLKVISNKTILGTTYDMTIIDNTGIAFDHAKMIIYGLIKLRDQKIINF